MTILRNIPSQGRVVIKKGQVKSQGENHLPLSNNLQMDRLIQEKKQELEHSVRLIETLAKELSWARENMMDHLKGEITEFIFAVCENILRKELSHPASLVRWIEELFQTASPLLAQERVNVFLAPEDVVKLQNVLSDIASPTSEVKKISFVADRELFPGDVRIETSTGLLNAKLSRHLDVMKKSLFKD